jgi:hypothetical protein
LKLRNPPALTQGEHDQQTAKKEQYKSHIELKFRFSNGFTKTERLYSFKNTRVNVFQR